MTTLIVHGTLGRGSPWYWNSWGPGGFCRALAEGMADLGQEHDIWRVRGKPVDEIPELSNGTAWTGPNGRSGKLVTTDGRFEWSGAAEGLARGAGALWLAGYLNAIRELTDEPIRIIAHSHGCNLVKLASSLPELGESVFIDKAVFLACPHFWEDEYVFAQPRTLEEKFDIRGQMTPKEKRKKFRYRAMPERFGRILNLYSEADTVQIAIAEKLSGTYVPLTGGFVDNLRKLFGTMDVYEHPHGSRTDLDPLAEGLYENVEVPVRQNCDGIDAHSILHGAEPGRPIGWWLAAETDMETLLETYGRWSPVACDDMGSVTA